MSSTAMTASAPSGIGAPVMILAASPGPTEKVGSSPAATSPTMCSRTGASPVPASESARTAYPSIDELSKRGRSTFERTSRATTRPSASVSGVHSVGDGSSVERIALRCSSTVRRSPDVDGGVGAGAGQLAEHGIVEDATVAVDEHLTDAADVPAEDGVADDAQARAVPHRRHTLGEALLETGDEAVGRVEVDERLGPVDGGHDVVVIVEGEEVGPDDEQVVRRLHRPEARARDEDRLRALEHLDRRAHRRLHLDDLGRARRRPGRRSCG